VGNTTAVVVDNRGGIVALNFKSVTALLFNAFPINRSDMLS